MKYARYGLLLMMCCSVSTYATTSILKKSPTHQQPIKHPWSVGALGLISSSPYKETKRNLLFLPMVGYHGDRFSFFGPTVSYKFLKTKQYSIAVEGQLYPQEFSPHNSSDPQLKQLDTRRYTYMAGINGTLNINRLESAQLSLFRSVIGAKSGYMIDGKYQVILPFLFKKSMFLITPAVGVKWSSTKLVKYYYGIDDSEATRSGLNAYSPKSAITPYLSLSFTYIYEKRWSANLSLSASRLSKQVTDSPMVGKHKRVATSALFMLSYSF